MDPDYILPPNVAVITLQELEDGNVLLRLAHLYEAGEDSEYSTTSNVELKKMFGKRTMKKVTETSLSTNQQKSEKKTMKWTVEAESDQPSARRRGSQQPASKSGGPVNASTQIVELGPMEIRTSLIRF